VLSLLADDLHHVEETVLLQQESLKTFLEVTCTKAVRPAELVDIRLFVEVVTILTDVVQLSVDGGVIFAPALIRHAAVPLEVESTSSVPLERRQDRLVAWIVGQHAQLPQLQDPLARRQEARLGVQAEDDGGEEGEDDDEEDVHHPASAFPPPT